MSIRTSFIKIMNTTVQTSKRNVIAYLLECRENLVRYGKVSYINKVWYLNIRKALRGPNSNYTFADTKDSQQFLSTHREASYVAYKHIRDYVYFGDRVDYNQLIRRNAIKEDFRRRQLSFDFSI